MPKLVLATTNKGKVREIQALLRDLPAEIMGLDAYPNIPPVEETGTTFQENAVIKAKTVAAYTHELTLADDSGLEVEVLDGAPGVYSARYGNPGWTDVERYQYLLRQLEGIEPKKRIARFRSVVALVDPDHSRLEIAEGSVSGVIASTPRGKKGFGYDPVFYFPQWDKTMAELDEMQKNQVSHRGRALAALKPRLIQWLRGDDGCASV